MRNTTARGILREMFLSESTPRGIALAIALGVAIGVIPKANLVALLFLTILFVTRTNLVAGLVAIVAATLCAGNFDVIFHGIGGSVLTISWLQGVYRWLFTLPIVPWTGLDNTVVVGGLVVGLLQLVPTYLLVRRLCKRQLAAWQMTYEDAVPE